MEYLYNDREDPWQLHPKKIGRNTEDRRVLELRKILKEYLDMLGDPFLWEKEREESGT